VLSSYLFARNVADLPLIEARTIATSVLVLVGLYLILALEAAGKKRGAAVSALCLVLLSLYVLALVLPTHEFFELAVPNAAIVAVSLAGAALSVFTLWLTGDRFVPGRAGRLRS
jgi:hypothetical protein